MVIKSGHLAAQLPLLIVQSVCVADDDPLSLCILVKTPSGEGCSVVSVPGHWCGDEEPLAEVLPGPRFLLLPGLCGGRQPSCGHPGQTPAGHHQEAGPAGDPLTQSEGNLGAERHKHSTCDLVNKL